MILSNHIHYRFLANEKPFKSHQEFPFIILNSSSQMTPIPMTVHGAITAVLSPAATCHRRGIATFFFTAPKTVVIANVEHGTLTVMKTRVEPNKCLTATPATHWCVAPCPEHPRLNQFACTTVWRHLQLSMQGSRHYQIALPHQHQSPPQVSWQRLLVLPLVL